MLMENNKRIIRIKVLSLGNPSAGKSCLIKRYCEKRFTSKYCPTIGVDYGSLTVDIDGRRISVHFFDTSGNNIFKDVRTEFYNDIQAILLTYDVTNRKSFLALDSWIKEVRDCITLDDFDLLTILVCGTHVDNATDSTRAVTETEARNWALKRHFLYVETSSALGVGVTNAFYTLFIETTRRRREGYKPTNLYSTKEPQKRATGGSSNETADSEINEILLRIIHSSADLDKMELSHKGLTKEKVNRCYRKLAGLVHPDKCKIKEAEEAFKILNQAKDNILATLNLSRP